MKTLAEIKKRALGVAQMHFYSDVDEQAPWEPFEDCDKKWIKREIKDMAEMLVNQMLWAQNKDVPFFYPNEITISWHIEDVQQQDSTLTDDEARQVLQLIKHKHDANIGVNWEVIDAWIDYFKRERIEK